MACFSFLFIVLALASMHRALGAPSGSGSSVSDADIATYLKVHNDFCTKHGAQPLTWSNELSNMA